MVVSLVDLSVVFLELENNSTRAKLRYLKLAVLTYFSYLIIFFPIVHLLRELIPASDTLSILEFINLILSSGLFLLVVFPFFTTGLLIQVFIVKDIIKEIESYYQILVTRGFQLKAIKQAYLLVLNVISFFSAILSFFTIELIDVQPLSSLINTFYVKPNTISDSWTMIVSIDLPISLSVKFPGEISIFLLTFFTTAFLKIGRAHV